MLRACLTLFMFVLGCSLANARDADALRAKHEALREALSTSPFGRPLHVQSRADRGEHEGEIYTVVDQPYRIVAPALGRPEHWCQILILQVNIKHCEAPARDALSAFVTKTARDPVDSAYRLDFRYELAAARDDYLRVELTSPSGPVGTSNYRLRLEAAPIDGKRTFIHMSYAYELGLAAQMAMDAYLATAGRNKVGFSMVERRPDGRPVYVDGVRGVVERSAMRYYLAIEAFLDSLAAPPGERLERRLRDWYAGTERYARQLRESIGPEEYLQMKRREAGRGAG
jgi:hypothetical protein